MSEILRRQLVRNCTCLGKTATITYGDIDDVEKRYLPSANSFAALPFEAQSAKTYVKAATYERYTTNSGIRGRKASPTSLR